MSLLLGALLASTATGAVSAPLTVGADPDGVNVTPDGKRAYVANRGDDTGLVAPHTVG